MSRKTQLLNRRHRFIALAALAICAVSAATLLSVNANNGSAAPKRSQEFGLDYGDTLFWMTPANRNQALDDAVTLGTRWVRIDMAWDDIQPDGPGTYQWARLDSVVQAARARNLEVLATLGYAPSWAWPTGCDNSACRPADPAAFASFAALAARRYAPQGVHTWEIWNEPNITIFWQPAPDPVAYDTLLQDTSRALRQADPNSFLLLGGLAAVPTTGGDISQTDFLAGVSKLGGNHLVDAVSYHPYNFPRLYSAKTAFGTPWERIDSYKDNLVGVLKAYGTPTMPVWVTEAGAPTGGPGRPYGPGNPRGQYATEQFQAQIATDAVSTTVADPHVAALFWYSDQDIGKPGDPAWDFYGLRHTDGTRKPAFAALQQALAAATAASPSAPAG